MKSTCVGRSIYFKMDLKEFKPIQTSTPKNSGRKKRILITYDEAIKKSSMELRSSGTCSNSATDNSFLSDRSDQKISKRDAMNKLSMKLRSAGRTPSRSNFAIENRFLSKKSNQNLKNLNSMNRSSMKLRSSDRHLNSSIENRSLSNRLDQNLNKFRPYSVFGTTFYENPFLKIVNNKKCMLM